VSPTKIQRREVVTVQWKGIQNPQVDDIVAVLMPEWSEDYTFLAHKQVKDLDPNWMHGSGMASFTLLNMRHNYQFRYYSNALTGKYELIASSNFIAVEDTYPLQGHLSYEGNPTEMTLTWVSNSFMTPKVLFGTKSSEYQWEAPGKSFK